MARGKVCTHELRRCRLLKKKFAGLKKSRKLCEKLILFLKLLIHNEGKEKGVKNSFVLDVRLEGV